MVSSADDVKVKVSEEKVVSPPPHLPQPEAPPGVLSDYKSVSKDFLPAIDRSLSEASSEVSSTIAKFLRTGGAALAKKISSMNESTATESDSSFTVFHLSGLKVIVRTKDPDEVEHDVSDAAGPETPIRGRVSFFTRSNCRDCSAVRAFFRERRLTYVEVNLDVFPEREREMLERTGGSAAVPQIFFNEHLVGGLVALNSLRNSGQLEVRLREMAGGKCPDTAPRVPTYGEDGKEKRRPDELLAVVRHLRKRLPIHDRIMKMKLLKNCFTSAKLVDALANHLDCGRRKAVNVGKELARKHFIHHVFREHDFEDGNHLYRFLEHDPNVPKCFNYGSSINDDEPKPAGLVGERLTKLMLAILEAYASDDRKHINYHQISQSEEFRRYANTVSELQRVDMSSLTTEQKLSFFMNLYNAMVIHAVISVGRPGGIIERRSFFNDFCYIIGGHTYSLSTIKNGILRSNRRQPYSFGKPLSSGDKRLELALTRVNPLIHFGLCNGARSSPRVRFFSPEGVEVELRHATREFLREGGVQVDLEKRVVHLTSIIKWYNADFAQDKELLHWIVAFLDAAKAGLLTHLLSDGGPVNVVYQDFDWSLNT